METKTTEVWKRIFSKPSYIITTIVVAILFYLINVIITNFSNLSNFYSAYGFKESITFFITLSLGFQKTIHQHSFITLIIISILFGVLISLILFKLKKAHKGSKKAGILGTIGLFFALLAPGCAACGFGLIAILGLSSVFLAFLPFKGLEISVIAIAIMTIAIFKISKDLTNCKVCKINPTHKVERGY